MNLSLLKHNKLPDEFFVIIEISMNSDPIKYELDDCGVIVVDRVMNVAMRYPCNYGFIPHTLGGDGDPLDVLVLFNYPIIPGAAIHCRPIGVLVMEDESGMDEKIIAVPTSKVDNSFSMMLDIENIPHTKKEKIQHFFEHYKDLEKEKWVKIIGWRDKTLAKDLILSASQNV